METCYDESVKQFGSSHHWYSLIGYIELYNSVRNWFFFNLKIINFSFLKQVLNFFLKVAVDVEWVKSNGFFPDFSLKFWSIRNTIKSGTSKRPQLK